MLRCIRCGACMNHCVVYRQIGGHAYGAVYPGPMGAVLTPVFDRAGQGARPAHACTMNGRCQEVCPVAIPLPTLLRGWRDRSWREGLEPASVRAGLGLWAFVARRPRLYRLATGAGRARRCGCSAARGWISSLPMAGGWTGAARLPGPARRGRSWSSTTGGEAPVTGTRERILAAVTSALGGERRDAGGDRGRGDGAAGATPS